MMDTLSTDTMLAFFALFSFVLGSMLGSFLNVCVYRMPRGLSVVTPRSACPECETPIAWYDNLPMVSWMILGAKCRHCSQPISWQYPLVEAITGALFLLVFWRFGFVVATPIYMAVAASMVLVTFIDLTDWTIPNEVTFPGIPLGVGCALMGMFYPESGLRVQDPVAAIMGLLLGGGILYSLDKLSLLLLKKRGMGFGDVKLMAMLGAFFGWQGAILNIMFASVMGSVVGITVLVLTRKQNEDEEGGGGHYLPFGPYLAAGGLLVMFFGQEIIAAYMNALQPRGAGAVLFPSP